MNAAVTAAETSSAAVRPGRLLAPGAVPPARARVRFPAGGNDRLKR